MLLSVLFFIALSLFKGMFTQFLYSWKTQDYILDRTITAAYMRAHHTL